MSIFKKTISALLVSVGSTFASESVNSEQVQTNPIRPVSECSVEFIAAQPRILGNPLTCADWDEFRDQIYYRTQHDKEKEVFDTWSGQFTLLDFSELVSGIFPEANSYTFGLNNSQRLMRLKKEARLNELLVPANEMFKITKEKINAAIKEECKEANQKIESELKMKNDWINRHVRIWGATSGRQFFDEYDEMTMGFRLAPHYQKIEEVNLRYQQDPELIAAQQKFLQAEESAKKQVDNEFAQEEFDLNVRKMINDINGFLRELVAEFNDSINSFSLKGLNLTYVDGPEHRQALYDFCLRKEKELLEKQQ
ncbi:MAG: hypothetical protein KBD31_04785 [Proteobacteria bacterium]|nr:hypothetical protein [Pseudomonadota bacterium]